MRRAHRRSAKEGEETAQDLGWNAVQWCVAEEGVGVANVWMFDWAHTYLQGGLLDVELGLLFKTFQKQKVADSGYKEFREFLESWSFPRGRHRPDNLFTDEQIRLNLEKAAFSCGASDLLSLAPILLKYFRDVVRPRGRCLGHVDSIIAVLESVELLQSCKDGSMDADRLEDRAVALAQLILIQCELCPRSLRKRGRGWENLHFGPEMIWPAATLHASSTDIKRATRPSRSPAIVALAIASVSSIPATPFARPIQILAFLSCLLPACGGPIFCYHAMPAPLSTCMQECIANHRRLFREVYGRASMRPKHHYAGHLPIQYRRFGILISCLTHERKHRLVKRYLFGLRNPHVSIQHH